MEKAFYITTTLPYVNADPHIGFAWELVQADIIARYHAGRGAEVFFNTGTDEHGLKIYRKALEEGKKPQAYVDEYAAKFRNLKELLNLSENIHFIRTTGERHKKAAQEFWKRCAENIDPKTGKPDIYKDTYRTKYCVGCELEKTDSELENGRCAIHSNLELELIEEENYFFRFSRYQKPLLALYEKHRDFVLPESKMNEIKNFVAAGLNDFSISRLKEKMPWGVPVPGDEKHVMYVWFDALISYISTLGWPASAEASAGKPSIFEEWWGSKKQPNGIQLAGKDQVRQQAAMWQAMLISAGLPNSKQIVIHGFITSNGEKMSKSLGNVVDPYALVKKYGIDAVRYWFAHDLNVFEDGDFAEKRFQESYNAHLANGLGNLVSRVMKLAKIADIDTGEFIKETDVFKKSINLEDFRIQDFANAVFSPVSFLDKYIDENKPFNMVKTSPEKFKEDMKFLIGSLYNMGLALSPIMPETSGKILEAIKTNSEITTPLFPRIL